MGNRRFLLALGLMVAACPSQKPAPVAPARPVVVAPATEPVVWRLSKSGVGFRLSNADPEPPPREKRATSTPLSPGDTARLLARMPAFERTATEKPFALREKSLPPPRPGETVQTPFPPPVAPAGAPPPATNAAPPSLVRFAPEGAVDIAPNVSLTFSEPMVALGSHGDVDATVPPMRLSPQPRGRFRWVGTQTLLFEPEGERLPKATDYSVEIPPGTRSAAGRALAENKGFRFSLPPVKVESFYPYSHETVKLDPTLLATFDQRVDFDAILPFVVIEPAGGKLPIGVRLATDEEIETDAVARQARAHAEPGRFAALKPAVSLPKATRFAANFKSGLPSAEGPKVTTGDQRFAFETYGPMKLLELTCGWYEGCPPLAGWAVRFSNDIDAAKFDRALVTVDPPLPGMKVSVSGAVISIQGRSKGRTKYKVRVGAALRDEFGQSLEKDAETSVSVDPAEPMLFPEERDMVVLDPAFKPTLSVYSVNRRTLRVRLYAVGPEHHVKYEKFRQDYDYDGKVTQPPGRLVADLNVRPDAKPDELVETRIELAKALAGGEVGQVLVLVEPPTQKPPTNRWDREREWVRTWVQATKLGLQAFQDSSEMRGWVTKLADGAPVAGAELGILKEGTPLPSTPGSVLSAADGIAALPLGAAGSSAYARLGKDVVFLPAGDDSTFRSEPRADRLLWFVMDDRNLYKPGERVHAKGWLRIASAGKKGDVAPLPAGKHSLKYRVNDPVSNKIGEGTTDVDPDGGFSFAFDLPKNANLGGASVMLELVGPAGGRDDRRYYHSFKIEEFRRPEFEVNAETTEGPHFVGNHAIATLRATYYAGGSLPDSDVRWNVSATDASFSPPNRSGYHFGKPPERFHWFFRGDRSRSATETWEARTSAGGEHRLRIDFDALDPAYPRALELEASVSDVNRQSWTAHTSLLVHPANVTVGLRLDN
ncbi:MAG TPA: Ig-like domain-containing protein, partial [Polyangiaceae bacterium]